MAYRSLHDSSRKYCPLAWRGGQKAKNLLMYRKKSTPTYSLERKRTLSHDIHAKHLTSKDKASHSLSHPQPNPTTDGSAQQPAQP